jgi:predicted transcriptional regulator
VTIRDATYAYHTLYRSLYTILIIVGMLVVVGELLAYLISEFNIIGAIVGFVSWGIGLLLLRYDFSCGITECDQ